MSKFNGKKVSLSENIAESFRGGLLFLSHNVDDVQEPSSPDLIAPSPPAAAVVEAEPMDVDTAAVTADNSTEPQRMQRKLVSKTYVNEEGYMGDVLVCQLVIV